jgi:hypothetical protein
MIDRAQCEDDNDDDGQTPTATAGLFLLLNKFIERGSHWFEIFSVITHQITHPSVIQGGKGSECAK